MNASRGWVHVGCSNPLAQEVLHDSCRSAPLPLRFLPPDFQALAREGACPHSTAAPARDNRHERMLAPRLLAGELAAGEQPLAFLALATKGAGKCAARNGDADAKQAALQRLLLARLRVLQLELAKASQAALAARAAALQAAMAAWPHEVLQLELADAFQAALRRLMLARLLVLQLELAEALKAALRRLMLARLRVLQLELAEALQAALRRLLLARVRVAQLELTGALQAARTAVAVRAALPKAVLQAAARVAAAERQAPRLQLADWLRSIPATVSESRSEYPCFSRKCLLAPAEWVL